jgi:hypothetical protein
MVKRVATRLPEERILALQQVGDRFCEPSILSGEARCDPKLRD